MKIIQITNTYKGPVLELVRECVPEGFEIKTLPENTEQALIDCVEDADYILASGRVRISEDVLKKARKLKMVQRTGVGLDSINLSALRDNHIPLYVNQGINAQSVAEHAVLLILACLRKLTLINQNMKQGIWKKQAQGITTFELKGKTVGVIGMGNIGRIVARILNAFDAKIIYFDQFRQSEQVEKELNLHYVPIENIWKESDIITLHCPLTDETTHLINEKTLAQMKKNIILVNTARGKLIDEQALLNAIESEKVGFAGLDVHETEPVQVEDILIKSERVITTPHIGGITNDSFRSMIMAAMRNIALYDQGKKEDIEEYRYKMEGL